MVTILHVDADEQTQVMVQSALGKSYNIITAADGPTAIQYCAMLQPDLILMNAALPGIAEDELISRLKMFMPQTPILIIANSQNQGRFPSSKVNGVLTKPLSAAKVAHAVQALLPPLAKPSEIAASLSSKEAVRQLELQIEALNRANKRLASLNAVSALIGTSLDLEHLTDEILAQIHRIIDFDSATLLLLKGDILEAASSRGFTEYRRGMNVYTRSDRNSAWRVVNNKLPMIIRDVTTSEYWESRPELGRIRSWLGVPLICKDRVVGVLTLDKNEPDAFTEADARYIFTLAYQIAIAVENAQLFEEWEDQATRLKLINEVAQEINTILNVDDLLAALARAIYERLNYSRVAILEVDPGRSCLVLKAIYGQQPPAVEAGEYQQAINTGLMGKVFETGRAVLVNDTAEIENELLLAGTNIGSELVVPIFGDNQQLEAIISVGQEAVYGFNDQDLWTVSSLASQAATAIENARLYHRLAQRLSDLAVLNEAGQALTSTIALDRMLSIVIERAALALSAENGYVLLMDSNDDMMTVAVASGPNIENVDEIKLSPAMDLINQVILEGEPSRFKCTTRTPSPQFARLSKAFNRNIDSLLIAPLKTRRIIIGLVILTNKQVGDFDDNDLNLLSALSQLMVGAVENAQLFKQIHAYSDKLEGIVLARTLRLQAIKKISQVVSQGLAVDELLAVVGWHISQIFTPEAFTDTVKVVIGLVNGSMLSLKVISDYLEGGEMQWYNNEVKDYRSLLSGASTPFTIRIAADEPLGQVIVQARPQILRNVEPQAIYPPGFSGAADTVGSVMLAPLITGGKTIGLIMVESHVPDLFAENDLETLETLAFQVASAIEHVRLLQKTREIAIVEERTRLARDMHDGVAQNLAYLLIQVDRCLNLVEEDSKLEHQLEQIGSLLKQNIEELRRNIFDLRPVELEGKSLFRVLENFVTEFGRRWNLETTCTIQEDEIVVSPEVESSLYRILQETLSNARRHAQCSQLSVTLATRDDQWVTLQVTDNGQGFDVNDVGRDLGHTQNGLGLISMRERVNNIGGRLVIESVKGQGTSVFAMLPLTVGSANGS